MSDQLSLNFGRNSSLVGHLNPERNNTTIVRKFLSFSKAIQCLNNTTIYLTLPAIAEAINCQNVSLSPEQCLHIKELAQQGICHFLPEICTWNSFSMERSSRS
ncbi:hypothetical protein [Gloeocapsopsis dulcis]|uniref:hypothetical protein n=1 Tax=Gloeocapsopsis dulcis TaxID=2859516 RepID=UPI00101AE210|nr:hypothetical protein [Gloeocapsopsis dulcis]WNN89537.1 hypothetical protein P0S91_00035 [Gloeocapsopsis dulcis]